MALTTQVHTSFTGGEYSPRAVGRADLKQYFTAAATLQNFIPRPLGGIEVRPGTRFIQSVKQDSTARLIPFQFSTIAAYVVEMGHQYARFFSQKSALFSGGVPYEITSPYAGNQIDNIRFVQSNDVLFLVHPDVQPQELRRNEETDWEFVDFEYEDGPYGDVNTNRVHKVRPLTTTEPSSSITAVDQGAKTFNVSGDQTGNVSAGELVRVVDSTGNDGVYTVVSAVFGGGSTTVTVEESIPDATADGTMEFPIGVTANKPTFAQSDADSYRHLRMKQAGQWGWGYITKFTDDMNVRVLVIDDFGSTSFSRDWRLGAFGDENADHPVESAGWPRTVMFHQNRLWFGGSSVKPQTLWASEVGDFNSFSPSETNDVVADDNGLVLTFDTDRVNTIYWMASTARGLAVGTDGTEFLVAPSDSGGVLTPDNANAVAQTYHGSRDNPRVATVGPVTLFTQKSGRKLRQLAFRFESDQFQADDLTNLADHILQDRLFDLQYAQEPWTTVWAILDNGDLLSMTYYIQGDDIIYAWSNHPMGQSTATELNQDVKGYVDSIAVIHEDNVDRLYMIVSQSFEDVTRRRVVFMEDRFDFEHDQEDAFFVDMGLTYEGAPTTAITGLDHLAGQVVAILADGGTHRDLTVDGSGNITLDRAASVVHVGLRYNAVVKPMPIEPQRAPAEPRGKMRGAWRAILNVHRSLGGQIAANDQRAQRIVYRNAGDVMNTPPQLFTGLAEVAMVSGYSRLLNVQIEQTDPLPMEILSLTYEIDLSGA